MRTSFVGRWMIAAVLALTACGQDNKQAPDGGSPENITPKNHTLAVQKSGSGAGTVSGGGIDCGATCSASIAEGTAVTLTATPDAASTFTSWTGCDTANAATCTLAMGADRTVVASFTSVPHHTLTVQKNGSGAGTVTGAGIDCGTTCSASVAADKAVTLTATPDATSSFAGWTGCDSTTGPTCTITASADKTVAATFNAIATHHTLTVQKSGTGSGTVAGGGIDCGATCTASIAVGTVVALNAAPDATSSFVGWTGCESSSGNACSITMNADRTVTATFAAPTGCANGSTRLCSADPAGHAITWPLGHPAGICSYGTQTCTVSNGVGTWGACIGAVPPADRDCRSALDNNCDGVPDNARDGVCQCQPGDPNACTGNPSYPGSSCPGTKTCVVTKASSSWTACNGAEHCECTAPQPCTAGTCTGTRPCVNGELGACQSGGVTLPNDCQCLAGQTRICGGSNCAQTQACVNNHFPACTNPSTCQCMPGQTEPCFIRHAGWCGTAVCAANYTWNESACHAPTMWCRDADNDGRGNPASQVSSCNQPAGYVANCTDCNDANASKYPGATCGLSGTQGPFACSARTLSSSCACQDALCSASWQAQCSAGGFSWTCETDTTPCPAGYTVSCGPCTMTSSNGWCTMSPVGNRCHVNLHVDFGNWSSSARYSETCHYNGP